MDSTLVTVFANTGLGGLVILCVILGYLVPKPTHNRVLKESARKDAVITKLNEALTLERQRSNDASQAGTVTNALIGGLLKLAGERRDDPPAGVPLPAVRAALDLTGKDLGL